jgi:hypothetical protein
MPAVENKSTGRKPAQAAPSTEISYFAWSRRPDEKNPLASSRPAPIGRA